MRKAGHFVNIGTILMAGFCLSVALNGCGHSRGQQPEREQEQEQQPEQETAGRIPEKRQPQT